MPLGAVESARIGAGEVARCRTHCRRNDAPRRRPTSGLAPGQGAGGHAEGDAVGGEVGDEGGALLVVKTGVGLGNVAWHIYLFLLVDVTWIDGAQKRGFLGGERLSQSKERTS